ncbi:hypothetical protein FRC17_002764 [Serendipita sp. 399]|nr:hypothetical protein FRC17_002764 [Serendipita sp. 399]
MKKFFGFQNKPNKPYSDATPALSIATSSTSNPNGATSGPSAQSKKSTERERTSPTISTRPTARNEFDVWRKMDVIPTEDALLIRPKYIEHEYTAKPSSIKTHERYLKIAWGHSKPIQVEEVQGAAPIPRTNSSNDADSNVNSELDGSYLEIFGIVGFMNLLSGSYILVVTSISHIGTLCSDSRPIYGIKGIAYIPLDFLKASTLIKRLVARSISAQKPPPPLQSPNNLAYGGGDLNAPASATKSPGSLHVKWAPLHVPNVTPDADSVLTSSPASSGISTPTSSLNGGVAIAPLAKTLAERLSFWKSKQTSREQEAELIASRAASGDHETLGDLMDEIDKGDPTKVESTRAIEDIVTAAAPEPLTVQARHDRLEEKVLRETVRQFTKGGMYFSYSFDLSSSLQRKQQRIERLKKREDILSDLNALDDWSTLESCEVAQPWKEPLSNVPLWRRVDRRFWWNEHLVQPLIEAELHSYVLPILQGYFQSAQFHIPVGEDVLTPTPQQPGQTSEPTATSSPSVKVEYIIISRRSRERAGLRYQRRGIDDKSHVANFVETEAIMRVITCVNLAEQHGKEGALTDAFRNYMDELNLPDAKYVINSNESALALTNPKDIKSIMWDFHAECRGMRYENISKLISQMERTFEKQGFFWISGSTVMSQQKGVFRVNCIDCLDRTNVVESAFARNVLTSQLEAVALLNESGGGRSEADNVFNDVWANNGDAISRAYAGTSALKGDFTRTGKRDLLGMVNDGYNSLARVYTSTFSDWFSQSVIDFMLGYRGIGVFTEFLQTLSSADPGDIIRLSKVREAAIEHAASMVILDEERLMAGWTLLSPENMNSKLADKFEEKILLLTTKAIYVVRYDYTLEKVKMSTRVPLGDIVGLQKGAYILSTLNSQTRDPAMNYGLVISFLAARQDTRVTSYSLRNRYNPSSTERTDARSTIGNSFGETLSQILSDTHSNNEVASVAFKSLPVDSARVYTVIGGAETHKPPTTPREAINEIVDLVKKACSDFGIVDEGFVAEGDIVR